MPSAPPHRCPYPGCSKLIPRGVRLCTEHEIKQRKESERYRASASDRGYDNTWRKIRKRYIQDHPWCVEHLKNGKYVPAQEVHHIKPISEGGTHDESNLMTLCKSCHSKIDAWGKRKGSDLSLSRGEALNSYGSINGAHDGSAAGKSTENL